MIIAGAPLLQGVPACFLFFQFFILPAGREMIPAGRQKAQEAVGKGLQA